MKTRIQSEATNVRKEVYESIGSIVSAFASPARLKIIQVLAQAECSVEELAQECAETIANTSQHLQRLAKVGIVKCERRGISRIYSIKNEKVLQIWEGFQDLAHEVDEQLNQKEDFLTDASLLSPQSTEEVMGLVADGKAVLLDARKAKESSMTKVPGAIAVPAADLSEPSKFKSLGFVKSKPIFVYCRGRYCSFATDAVRELRSHGYKAYRLRESPFQLQLIQGEI